MLHRHLAGPVRPVQLHERERGHYVDTNGSTTQTPCGLGTWNNMTGRPPAPRHPGALRGHERVDDADALRLGTWTT